MHYLDDNQDMADTVEATFRYKPTTVTDKHMSVTQKAELLLADPQHLGVDILLGTAMPFCESCPDNCVSSCNQMTLGRVYGGNEGRTFKANPSETCFAYATRVRSQLGAPLPPRACETEQDVMIPIVPTEQIATT